MWNRENNVEIALRPTNATHRSLPPSLPHLIQSEFASKYLEKIGATPSDKNVETLLKELPVKDALLVPIWGQDTVIIFPGLAAKVKDPSLILKELFSVKKQAEDGLNSRRQFRRARLNSKKKKKEKDRDHDEEDEDGNEQLSNAPAKKVEYNKTTDRNSHIAGNGRRISWCTVNTLDVNDAIISRIGEQSVKSDAFVSLLKPLKIENDKVILNPVKKFSAALGDYVPRLKDDARMSMYITRMLESKGCFKLYSLCAQYCYWYAIHPIVKRTLIQLKPQQNMPPEYGNYDDDLTVDDDSVSSTNLGGAERVIVRRNSILSKNIESHAQRVLRNSFGEKRGSFDNEGTHAGTKLGNSNVGDSPTKKVNFSPSRASFSSPLTQRNLSQAQLSPQLHDGEAKLSEFEIQCMPGGSIASDSSMPEFEKEELFLHLQQCLCKIQDNFGSSNSSMTSCLNALVGCSHYTVDYILGTHYPWLNTVDKNATEEDSMMSKKDRKKSADINVGDRAARDKLIDATNVLRLELRRFAHQSLADILDPARIYTSDMLISSMVRHAPPFRKTTMQARLTRGKVTSASIKAVFGDCSDAQTRIMLHKGQDVYVPIPGVVRQSSAATLPTGNRSSSPARRSSQEYTMGPFMSPGTLRDIDGGGEIEEPRQKTKEELLDDLKVCCRERDGHSFGLDSATSTRRGKGLTLRGRSNTERGESAGPTGGRSRSPPRGAEAVHNRSTAATLSKPSTSPRTGKNESANPPFDYHQLFTKTASEMKELKRLAKKAHRRTSILSNYSNENEKEAAESDKVLHSVPEVVGYFKDKYIHGSRDIAEGTIRYMGQDTFNVGHHEKMSELDAYLSSRKALENSRSRSGYLAGHDIDSDTLGGSETASTTHRAKVVNPKADVEISIKAKTTLMNIILDKASNIYHDKNMNRAPQCQSVEPSERRVLIKGK